MWNRKRKLMFFAPMAIIGVVLFLFLGGSVVQMLWNWLLPSLFGWHEVTFWQALGILALCRILFGGFGRHGGYRGHSRMSSEERDRFRHRVRERFGFGGSPSADTADRETGPFV